MNEAPRRVVTTKSQLEKLIMDITSHDLNLQMQQLISDYRKQVMSITRLMPNTSEVNLIPGGMMKYPPSLPLQLYDH